MAEEELHRASEITAQGLQFHWQSSSPTSTKVVELLRSVMTLFGGKVKAARIEIELKTKDAPELVCFPGEIRQAFVNLIDNAIESMPYGGQLKVKVRPGTDWKTLDHGVRVTLAHTGYGIGLETKKHIFEAFFTTKGSEGSGLGLWVTSNIVKKHHGCIHVRNRCLIKGGGTVFSVVFSYRGAEGKAPGFQGHAA
jgi:signal transduction histidine kinase